MNIPAGSSPKSPRFIEEKQNINEVAQEKAKTWWQKLMGK
jgi:hypothetical protein